MSARLPSDAGLGPCANQQQVVVNRSPSVRPRILLLDECTMSIDAEVNAEIVQRVKDVAASGAGVIIASPELEELTTLGDRVLVLSRGRLASELIRTRSREISADASTAALHAALLKPAGSPPPNEPFGRRRALMCTSAGT